MKKAWIFARACGTKYCTAHYGRLQIDNKSYLHIIVALKLEEAHKFTSRASARATLKEAKKHCSVCTAEWSQSNIVQIQIDE